MQLLRYFDAAGLPRYAARQGDTAYELDGDPFGTPTVTGRVADVRKVLAPVAPTAILCVGLNYRRHAEETGAAIPTDPVLFFKAPTAVQHPGDPIELPTFLASTQVDYECELAVVIGRACKNVRAEDALGYVAGYTCANDVSARDWQIARGGSQWSRGKTFDTFCPLGPVLVTPDELPDPGRLGIRTVLNGEVVQRSSTDDLIFSVPEIIAFLSGSTTLAPGTVLLTGTPEGVGMARKPPRWLRAGDTVTVEIEGIGALTNPVVDERA